MKGIVSVSGETSGQSIKLLDGCDISSLMTYHFSWHLLHFHLWFFKNSRNAHGIAQMIALTFTSVSARWNSYKDLKFLIPEDWDPSKPLPYKFVVFFDNINRLHWSRKVSSLSTPLEATWQNQMVQLWNVCRIPDRKVRCVQGWEGLGFVLQQIIRNGGFRLKEKYGTYWVIWVYKTIPAQHRSFAAGFRGWLMCLCL
jgi:hypothetical protein